MSHPRLRCLRWRHWLWALALGGGLLALLPRRAWAACGPTDLGACVDGAVYDAWVGAASVLWMFDRTLLALAFQLDSLRAWLIEIAFAGVYDVLVGAVGPLLPGIATLAAVIGGLGYFLIPLIGRTNLVNLRHVIVWVVIAPVLLTASGPLLVELDNGRVAFGSALFAAGGEVGTVPMLGAAAGDMASPAALYPSNPCGSGTFARSVAGLRPDDLAAALLYADARDIHCPEAAGLAAVPQRFFEEAPTGPQYAVTWKVADESDPVRRTNAIAGIQQGVSRLALGILPCLMAVLDALLQLLFSLCMVALWVSLPIGLLFIFFQQTASGVGLLFRRTVAVLQVSWSCSFVTGLFFLCLTAAADLGNAAAYTGFAVGSLIVDLYLLSVAKDTLRDSVRTLNEVVLMNTGLSVTAPVEMAAAGVTGAATLAAAVASGGAAMALTGAAALAQTGSDRYALGAALGRIRPVYQLGEVARLMGTGDDEVLDGMYAGSRGAHSLRAMGRQMQTDARRTDEQGRTMGERAIERRVARDLAHDRQPTLLQQGLTDMQTLAGVGRDAGRRIAGAGAYALGDGLADDLGRAGATVRANWNRLRDGTAALGARVALTAGTSDPLQVAAAAAIVADEALARPDHHADAITLDARGKRRYLPRVADADMPAHAQRAEARQVAIPRLLTLGYTVQRDDDGTVVFWERTERGAARPGASRMGRSGGRDRDDGAGSGRGDELGRLVKAGALRAGAVLVAARTEPARDNPPAQSSGQPVAAPSAPSSTVPSEPTSAPVDRAAVAPPSPAAVEDGAGASTPGIAGASARPAPEPAGQTAAHAAPLAAGEPAAHTPAPSAPASPSGGPRSSTAVPPPAADPQVLARLDQIDGRLDDLARQQGSIGEQVAREADADAEARATGISAAQRAELDETERAARDAGERTSRAIDEAARAEAARDAQAQQIGGVPLAFATLPPGIAAMRAERRLAEAQAHRAALVPNEPTGRAVRAADLAVQRAEAELAYHRLRAARADVAFELDAAEDDAAVTGDARVREARTRWEEHRRRYQEASRDEADEADTPEEDHHA